MLDAPAWTLRCVGLCLAAGVGVVLVSACSDADRDVVRHASPLDEEEPPGATETNFFRLPCAEDTDCLPGERCLKPEPEPAADAGLPAGRCAAPDRG